MKKRLSNNAYVGSVLKKQQQNKQKEKQFKSAIRVYRMRQKQLFPLP